MSGSVQPVVRGWTAWLLWTLGVLLRWASGFYHLYWRALLPLSAALELTGFAIFLYSVRTHRPARPSSENKRMPMWIVSVLIGTAGFGAALVLNLIVAIYVSLYNTGPAFPLIFEARFLFLVSYAFIVPTVWGFSARWLPVFLGLKPLNERTLRYALLLSIAGVVLAVTGFTQAAHWVIMAAAVVAVAAFRLCERPRQKPKTAGVHGSFPTFVRIAYLWLLIAATVGIWRLLRSRSRMDWRFTPCAHCRFRFDHGIRDRPARFACLRRHAGTLQHKVNAELFVAAESGMHAARQQ